jgi:hypothetical protein
MTNSDNACRRIRSAKNESEVLAAVRQYLDSLDAKDIALLPAGLLALGLTPAEELIQSALQLLHTALDAAAPRDAGVVKDASLVFTTAARRLAALAEDAA